MVNVNFEVTESFLEEITKDRRAVFGSGVLEPPFALDGDGLGISPEIFGESLKCV